MREHREWTNGLDATIKFLRAEHKTWEEVAEIMDLPLSTVFKRWQKIMAIGPYAPQVSPEERSRMALKQIINVPVFQPEAGAPPACCQWINGDLRAGGFMCDAVTVAGKSYCELHQRRAMVKPRTGRNPAPPVPDFSLANFVGMAA